jgi:hypothetical protein
MVGKLIAKHSHRILPSHTSGTGKVDELMMPGTCIAPTNQYIDPINNNQTPEVNGM